MVGMLCKWLFEDAPKNIDCIELVFPVTGHSFLPADRVFAQIEKKVKKVEVLTRPSQYIDILKESGTVYHLGLECEVRDWKQTITDLLKSTAAWNFPFRQAKRLYLTHSRTGNVLVRGAIHYNNDLNADKCVFKKGKTPKTIRPTLVNRHTVHVSNLKLKDVKNLLEKHFGEKWRELEELKFYSEVIDQEILHNPDQQDDHEGQEPCEFNEELPSVLI